MTTLICYRKCSTCKGVERTLQDKGVPYTYREIDTHNPTADELKAWHQQSGLPLRRFFNTSGIKYREMGLSQQLNDMPEDAQYALLATDGMLVKRPIVLENGQVHVGRDAVTWANGV